MAISGSTKWIYRYGSSRAMTTLDDRDRSQRSQRSQRCRRDPVCEVVGIEGSRYVLGLISNQAGHSRVTQSRHRPAPEGHGLDPLRSSSELGAGLIWLTRSR
jgi:hypothetical protein